jgi:predicted transcriptional regulator
VVRSTTNVTQHPRTKIAVAVFAAGLTHSELAGWLGVTPQAVGIWLRGDEPCPASRQAQFAIYLDTKASQLFDAETGVAIGTES